MPFRATILAFMMGSVIASKSAGNKNNEKLLIMTCDCKNNDTAVIPEGKNFCSGQENVPMLGKKESLER